MKNCKYYESCSSPFCPLNKKTNNNIWYPNEQICNLKKFTKLPYIQLQKKIIKKTRDINKYYTIEMLNSNCIVGKGIIGLDPDYDKTSQLQKWLIKHPTKRNKAPQQYPYLNLKPQSIGI